MIGEPPLAHPAKRAGSRASSHPHPGDDHDRDQGDQHDDSADEEQHLVLDMTPPRVMPNCSEWTCAALFSIAQHKA